MGVLHVDTYECSGSIRGARSTYKRCLSDDVRDRRLEPRQIHPKEGLDMPQRTESVLSNAEVHVRGGPSQRVQSNEQDGHPQLLAALRTSWCRLEVTEHLSESSPAARRYCTSMSTEKPGIHGVDLRVRPIRVGCGIAGVGVRYRHVVHLANCGCRL